MIIKVNSSNDIIRFTRHIKAIKIYHKIKKLWIDKVGLFPYIKNLVEQFTKELS